MRYVIISRLNAENKNPPNNILFRKKSLLKEFAAKMSCV